MNIDKKRFGTFDGMDISLYTLKNDTGMEVSIMNYGATITSVLLPDGENGKINIVCGFDHFEQYFSPDFLNNAPFFGATIGRYCATIQNAQYNDVTLSANAAGVHSLHGGIKGFDKKVWGVSVHPIQENECSVRFMLFSPDGDQGFPGNVLASVVIALNNDNELSFSYEAETDARTPLSMTSHAYYNLSGFSENVEGHHVQVNSTKVFPLNAVRSVAEDTRDVTGTIEDTRQGRIVKEVHEALHDGFEHFYLFDKGLTAEPEKVAEITCPAYHRQVEISTTEAGMLFYTAKYTSDALCRNENERYGKYCAFCCESHRTPNGPNLPDAQHVFTDPDEKFTSKTIFKFTF